MSDITSQVMGNISDTVPLTMPNMPDFSSGVASQVSAAQGTGAAAQHANLSAGQQSSSQPNLGNMAQQMMKQNTGNQTASTAGSIAGSTAGGMAGGPMGGLMGSVGGGMAGTGASPDWSSVTGGLLSAMSDRQTKTAIKPANQEMDDLLQSVHQMLKEKK